MQLSTSHTAPLHLTYCTNVHSGDSVKQAVATLEGFSPVVHGLDRNDSALIAWGLFLGSDATAQMILDPSLTAQLSRAMSDANAYALTMNAFPMGGFHDRVVKSSVYRPDWNELDRVQHTLRAAQVLAALPSQSSYQSISTLPGSYKGFGRNDVAQMAHHMAGVAEGFSRIEADTGRRIILAVEPEPGCTFETTAEWVAFFEDTLIRVAGTTHAEHAPVSETTIRRHIGTCFDCCHQSVEYEDVAASLRRLRAAGIAIAKVQLSTALRCEEPARSKTALQRLASFDEPRYLHQVGAQSRNGVVTIFNDLCDYLDEAVNRDDLSCRVHFHVPIFESDLGAGLMTTRPDLTAVLKLVESDPITEHLEIETYSFDVLPQSSAPPPTIEQCISQEYQFVQSHFQHP